MMRIHTKVFIGLALFALLGLFLVPDYGMSFDDQHNREFGLATAAFIHAKLTGEPYVCANEYCVISKYHGLIHGPAFELFLVGAENLSGYTDLYDIYLLRHALTWLCFCIGLMLFYLLAQKLTNNSLLSLFGLALLALTPRIFAEAFYNSVDIPFLVGNIATAYTLVRLLEQPTWQRTIFHGVITGITADIRIVGGLWVPLTLGLLYVQSSSESLTLKRSLLYLGTFLGTLILCWPLLWQSPLLLVPAITEVAQFDMIVFSIFNDQVLTGPGSPWSYLPVWMGITLPLGILVLGLVGFSIACRRLYAPPNKTLISFIPLYWFLFPLLLVMVCNPTLYSGWRHFLFIYPALVLLALIGIQAIAQKLTTQRARYLGLALLVGVLLHLLFSVSTLHPYQHLYFNALAPSITQPCQAFDTDYWGLSYKEIFEQVLKQDNRSRIAVYTAHLQAPHFYSFLPPEQRARITLVNTTREADYYVTNYYEKKNLCQKNSFRNISITKRVNGIPLYTIQKLR